MKLVILALRRKDTEAQSGCRNQKLLELTQ